MNPPRSRTCLPLEDRHLTVLLEQQAARRPEHPFITIGGQTYTYQTAWRKVQRLAASLAAAGITENDRIAVLLPNCQEFVFLWFAASHLGAANVVINPQLRGAMLDAVLSDAECRMVVLHATGLDALAAKLPALQAAAAVVAVVGAAGKQLPDGLLPFEELEAQDAAPVPRRGDYRTVQTMAFTSGSTGPSKGVLVSNNQALDVACTFIHAVGLTGDDVIYTPFPLFHGMSNRLAVLPALITGAHVVVAERFSASGFWKDAIACQATIAQTLHTVTALLKAQPPSPLDRAHAVRRMYNSRYDEEFEHRFGVQLVEAFGMTEIGVVAYTPYPERRLGSAGRVHPGWEMCILDDNDRPVAQGEPGELAFRPREPFLMTTGYARKPQAMVDATRNLWFHTGDVARMDADGFMYFLDRKKERIRRRGENISSFDVELLVSAHPDVRECAALPHPAEHGEDELRLVVVPDPQADLQPAALYAWLLNSMPRFMLPRYIEITTILPRTHNNKIEKFQLIAQGLGADAWDREKQ